MNTENYIYNNTSGVVYTGAASGTSATSIITGIGGITYSEWHPVEPTKKERMADFIAKIESEDRLKLILEKVRSKKLSVDEAVAILKGDKSIEIG